MAAKTKNQLVVTLPSDTEIQLVREFNAPRLRVWDAMVNPEYLRQWWGLRTNELTTCEIDLKVGGVWRFVSRDPQGNEHPFTGVYQEIVAPERIVQTSRYDLPPFNKFESVETMTLAEHGGRTTVTTLVRHQSKEARDGHVQSGMERGAAETFDRLEELLPKIA